MPKTVPCATCPWRKSSTVGGFDIPTFDLDKMRNLAQCFGPGDAFRPVMACHGSACGADETCIGYVAQGGWANLNVRVLAMRGVVDISGILDACADIEMWDSFDEMLAAYEEANDAI